ncbi:MAG: ferredoxin [Firmicutes bacterium HGW-Firmicutes-1]|jgi:hypothetical protein|nr:MAG: ferredoxin [Firmicutes bacterium HGW-Firmicutes-1]
MENDELKEVEGCSCCSDCGATDLSSQDECVGDSNCCTDTPINNGNKRRITIDFLYLDLSTCERCQGTDTSLDEALKEVENVLKLTGVEVITNKVNVNTADLAKQYKFLSSPTIRVNGRDIQMEVKENNCTSCGDLCGNDVDCRTWSYDGDEYDVPPKAMIIESILKMVYGNIKDNQEVQEYVLPRNLQLFYLAMDKKYKKKK